MNFLIDTPEKDVSLALPLNPRELRTYEALIDENAPAKHFVITNFVQNVSQIYTKIALRWVSAMIVRCERNSYPGQCTLGYFTHSINFVHNFMDDLRRTLEDIYNADAIEQSHDAKNELTLKVGKNSFVFHAERIHERRWVDNNLTILDLHIGANPVDILSVVRENNNLIGIFHAVDEKSQELAEKMCQQLKPAPCINWKYEIVEEINYLVAMEAIAENAKRLMKTRIENESCTPS